MKSTQNKKIEQVKETTMIVGIDVGSEKHYFRAFNWRGIELTRKPIPFSNSMAGFDMFHSAVVELMENNHLEEALVGFEPTGHYWFNLGQFLSGKNIKFVMVNPHHVHKTKELDWSRTEGTSTHICLPAYMQNSGMLPIAGLSLWRSIRGRRTACRNG